ncbi:hypothetical protein [Puia dinghuensis]|uniref:Uncharacterized protein n=1 Tax=Puia dinghuensis TaxID=1792502 RepID=A0A8J2UEG2_9BACT|nr:hypothetical protein [Puia dinghuensis]GGB06351.1 hypothetical protein GCM10011511_32200 [Puia dinghuensis]
MLKRLSLVALFTGSAQLTTLIALKYLAGSMDAGRLTALGDIDSLLNLIINLIGLGLLMSSVRDIAITKDWQLEVDKAQTARMTLSLCLIPAAAWSIYNHDYRIFLFAPIFALNADYALYGRSYPVLAACLAFARVLIPYIFVLIAAAMHSAYTVEIFLFSSVLVYLGSGLFIARFLGRPYWRRPSWKSLHLYWLSLGLGIASLSYYFIGLGLIPIVVYFYDDRVAAAAYVGCKVYMIFKGVLRIISQSFIKEMVSTEVQLQVDRLAGFAGFLFLAGVLFYPNSFIKLFLSKALEFDKRMLIILALAGLAASVLISYVNRAILEKRDRPYSVITGIATLASIAVCIILSFFLPSAASVFIAILVGELISMLGLVGLFRSKKDLILRSKIWLKYILLAAIPLGVRVCWGDSLLPFFAGMGLMGGAFLLVFHKRLRL